MDKTKIKYWILFDKMESEHKICHDANELIDRTLSKRRYSSKAYYLLDQINKIRRAFIIPDEPRIYEFKSSIIKHYERNSLNSYINSDEYQTDFNKAKIWWTKYRNERLLRIGKVSPKKFITEMGDLIPWEFQDAIELTDSIDLENLLPEQLLYIIYSRLSIQEDLKEKFDDVLDDIICDPAAIAEIKSELVKKIEWNGLVSDFAYLVNALFDKGWIHLYDTTTPKKVSFLMKHFSIKGSNGAPTVNPEYLKKQILSATGDHPEGYFKITQVKRK